MQEIADNIYFDNGIWFSKSNREISYPKEAGGNMDCYQIEQDSFWFAHRNNCILEAVRMYSPNAVFFDIGGGNGYVSKGLEENNIESVLVEPGPAGALNAKARGLKNIICSTFEDAGIRKDTCQAIGLFDVVEHIEDDVAFLQAVNAIQAPGGHIYVTVPAHQALWSQEDVDAGHYRRYTTRSIGEALKKAGYEVVYSTYLFSLLPVPLFLFRTLPTLLHIKRNSSELNKYKKEHATRGGVLSKAMNALWAKEVEAVKGKRSVPVGTSCFIVAKKPAIRS